MLYNESRISQVHTINSYRSWSSFKVQARMATITTRTNATCLCGPALPTRAAALVQMSWESLPVSLQSYHLRLRDWSDSLIKVSTRETGCLWKQCMTGWVWSSSDHLICVRLFQAKSPFHCTQDFFPSSSCLIDPTQGSWSADELGVNRSWRQPADPCSSQFYTGWHSRSHRGGTLFSIPTRYVHIMRLRSPLIPEYLCLWRHANSSDFILLGWISQISRETKNAEEILPTWLRNRDSKESR